MARNLEAPTIRAAGDAPPWAHALARQITEALESHRFDIAKAIASQKVLVYVPATGVNVIDVDGVDVVFVEADPGANWTLGGLKNAKDGQDVRLWHHLTGRSVTIAHESAACAPETRLYLTTEVDTVATDKFFARFTYIKRILRWLVTDGS